MDSSLTVFFQPKGIVIVGASTAPEKLGYGVARNLVQSGFAGAIHFVSQKTGSLFERPIHTDLAQVPDPVDLAILIVPPQATIATLRACGARGIRAAIVVSAGFREAGPEGAALEAQCVAAAREQGIRILGPNCIGVIDTHLPFDSTFLQPPMPAAGNIGFISHSGAFCAAIIDWARGQDFGFSRIASLGNQADVSETDMLPILAADGNTRVIVLYMEGVSDGQKFIQAARQAVLSKPVIALKVGRFEAGQKAAASHTGALAGSDIAFEAAFHKAGILRAETTEQMFDWARALASCPLPAGRRMAILTNAGGPGVIAADALETNNLTLAKLSEESRSALAAKLPAAASVQNPVDMLASASPEQYAQCLEILIKDEAVDGVMVILPPPPMFEAGEVAAQISQVIQRSKKPIVVALLGSMLVQNAQTVFKREGVTVYAFPEHAASALAALVRRSEYLAHRARDKQAAGPSAAGRSRGPVSNDPLALLEQYGIRTAPIKLAKDEEEAVELAARIGFPVVMKIASPDIIHKSDVGGVRLGLKNEQEVHAAYVLMLKTIKAAKPEADIQGVFLQHEVSAGQEVIVGMARDPLFGPLMMFGSGGVEVEGLKDIAFALAPLSHEEARDMIQNTWAGRKLQGFRNIPPADRQAVIDTLVKLSCLAAENEQVQEIEINPLRVLAEGAIPLDVRMRSS